MKNIEDINKEAIKKIVASKKITDFSPGDTLKVGVRIVEGKRERIHGRKNRFIGEVGQYAKVKCTTTQRGAATNTKRHSTK